MLFNACSAQAPTVVGYADAFCSKYMYERSAVTIQTYCQQFSRIVLLSPRRIAPQRGARRSAAMTNPRATNADLTAKARVRNAALDLYAQYGEDRVSFRAIAPDGG